ncbi:hypothetical protein E2C01_101199 [Portunus trituberculatus]|uniref:Uncharacterized protein n=1 Tax=Portunus trituberculatus TaxID=210409 RepID=A0A5B7KF82_PORTR|nr:hypothetical protein [Portunus trituberculatus]
MRGLTARRSPLVMAVQFVSCGTRQRAEIRRAALVSGQRDVTNPRNRAAPRCKHSRALHYTIPPHTAL